MGGNAFTQSKDGRPALKVPRLSHEAYYELRDHYCSLISEFFEDIACPAEAPGKLDHGDVDFVVQNPKPDFSAEKLMNHLGAIRRESNGPTSSYAVPLHGGNEEYAQVDVHICKPGYMQWELLMGSYGDLWQIIGVLLRPLGLTANDQGLHVRLAEIEPHNRKASMVLLTVDRTETFTFLGLDSQVYDVGFQSEEAIFDWASRGYYFQRDIEDRRTSNDRQRINKRAMFARFVNEWAPAHPEAWQREDTYSREDLLKKAIRYFNKEKVYEDLISEWQLMERDEALWSEIKEELRAYGLDGERLGLAIRALKRWIHWQSKCFSYSVGNAPRPGVTVPEIWVPAHGDALATQEAGKLAGSAASDVPAIRTEANMEPYGKDLWICHLLCDANREALKVWIRQNWAEIVSMEKARVKAEKDKRLETRRRVG